MKQGPMSRLERDLLIAVENAKYSEEFTPMTEDRLALGQHQTGSVAAAWRSKSFVAALWIQDDGALRLSVNRTRLNDRGTFVDGITWDELMAVKRGVGYGDTWAVEVYPPDAEVVNVSNMRHLFLLDEPPCGAWCRRG